MKQLTIETAAKFKESYNYKMGGSQILQFPNGQEFIFNDKEYYSGRGAKYNSSIKHDNKGVIVITKKQVADFFKKEKEAVTRLKKIIAERKATEKRIAENEKTGIYGLSIREHGTLIELSTEESEGRFFDEKRLAATLDISIEDARLLNSRGKTYVFAKQITTGKIIELYHASLSCNPLNIWVSYPSADRLKEFNHDEWASAPYSHLVGMTEKNNHFVC